MEPAGEQGRWEQGRESRGERADPGGPTRAPDGIRRWLRGRRVSGVFKFTTGQWVLLVVLSFVWAAIGYRLSENDRRSLGRTPWGLPSALWAVFWFLSLVLGLVLYLIAHTVGVRRAQQNPTGMVPGGLAPPPSMEVRSHASRQPTAAEQFPAYPRPANSQPIDTQVVEPAVPEPAVVPPAPDEAGHAAADETAAGVARLTAGLASRPERPVPLPLVGRERVDLAGLDRRAPPGRHQSGPAHRALLTHRRRSRRTSGRRGRPDVRRPTAPGRGRGSPTVRL